MPKQGLIRLSLSVSFTIPRITATDSEAELLVAFLGRENIHVGNVGSDKDKAGKVIRLFPDGKEIKQNLVYPKPNESELRLYLSERAGFKPTANSIWFMFVRDSELWIGSMPEAQWRDENIIIVYDETENIFQDSLLELDAIKLNKLKARDVFARDRNLALERIRIERYLCEYNASHHLFNSRHSLMPYLEAHHLIPLALQNVITKKLDVIENIFSLCPNCHRAIHHAEKDLTRHIINKLVDKRPVILDVMNVTVTDVFSFYSVEDIY